MISAIIIAYNNADYIAAAVNSALVQEPPFAQIVVVEDCSTDDTFAILQELVAANPAVQLIRHAENSGPGAARNTGMDVVDTPFFCFLDGDDRFYESAIEVFHKAIQTDDTADLWMFQGKRFTDTSRGRIVARIPETTFGTLEEKKTILRSVTFPWNALYRTEFVKQHNIRFPTGKYEDIPWCYACRLQASRIVGVAEPIIWYRIHPQSTLNRVSDHHFAAIEQWHRVFDIITDNPNFSATLAPFVKVSALHQLSGILFSKRLPPERRPAFAQNMSALLGPLPHLRRAVRTDPEREKMLPRFRRFRKYLDKHPPNDTPSSA